jgi:hypothetical protein
MSERVFHLLVGLVLLVALCFNLSPVVYGLIAWLAFEVLTDQRLTTIVSRFRCGGRDVPGDTNSAEACQCRFNFQAERALRLVLVLLLTLSYVLFYGQLWIVTWFVGFALVAAGLSGICPMIMTLRKLGFR